MHVLMIAKDINYYYRGGLARHTIELSRTLRKLGCRLTLMCRDTWENRSINFAETVFVPSVKLPPLDLLSFNVNILGRMKNVEADLIHSQSGHGFASLLYQTIPLIATAHGSPKIVMKVKPSFKYHLSPYFNILADILTFKGADKVISVSNEVKELLHYDYGIENEKIEIIPNGVDTEKFNPDLDGSFVRQAYSEDAALIVCVTRIAHDRFVKELVLSMKEIQKGIRQAKLIIVGDGPATGDITKLIIKEGQNNNILLVGAKSDLELPFYYAVADVCVSPIIYTASTKELTILEALASGKPFVGIDRSTAEHSIATSSMKENPIVVRSDKDFVETVVYLLHNEDQRRKLGLQGRKLVVEKFSWESVAAKTLKLYESIAS